MDRSAPTHSEAAPRRWPVRLILIGVVFALVLPGIVFAGVLASRIAHVERARSEDAAIAAAAHVAEAVDRELANLAAALRALATSPALATGDLDTFAAQARAVATDTQALVLTTVDGRQLLNTRRATSDGLPRMADMVTLRSAVETRRTLASNMFMGAVTGVYSVVVMHPVVHEGRVAYVLAMNLDPLFLSTLVQSQGLQPGWIASVVDGNGSIIARNHNPEQSLGQRAPPPLGDPSRPAPSPLELHVSTSLEGEDVLVATQTLRLADWRVGVGVPTHAIQAPLRATLRWLAITGLVAVAIAGLMAWQLARAIAAPLHRLAVAGADLAAGLPVTGVRSSIAEVDSVSRALVRATQDLRERAQALAAERAQLAAVIETVPVGLVIAEADGRVVAGNRRLDFLLRHPLKRSQGVAAYTEWHARHANGAIVQPHEFPIARVLDREPGAELQCLYQRGDGSNVWVRIVAAPIVDDDGMIAGAVAALVDMDEVMRAREAQARFAERLEQQVRERTAAAEAATQRLRDEMAARAAAEEQLRQAQKMEAVGQLTGGLAHDFNNLLTVVIGSLDLLRRRAEDDRSRRLLDNALDGAGRAATLTARLLAFSRRQPLMPQALDVNALVTGMVDLLHRTLGETVQLETHLPDGLWQTHADPNQLENALLNLAVNGRDAVAAARPGPDQPPGRLVITTANTTLGPAFAAHDPDFTPGDYVTVAVTDTGTGMAPEVAARVFEPFFTTKPVGQGTGLGLSQVHGFVKQTGGHVTIDSTPGRGTTVAIHLPRLRVGVPLQAPTPATRPEPADPGLVVLVVEDDAGVRQFSVEALRELGHTVLEAGRGTEALQMLDDHPAIDVLLTDVVLPGMDGPAIAKEAGRRRPGLPVLFASGYTGSEAMNVGLLPPDAPLLQKPYTLQALAAKLRQAMHPPRHAADPLRPAGLEPATKPL